MNPVPCRFCGIPLLGELGESCWKCRKKKPEYFRCVCPQSYGGEWKILIQRFKLQGERSLAGVLSRSLESLIPRDTVIIPVPGNPGNNHVRGFDPGLEVAKVLCRNSHRRLLPVIRRKKGRSQKKLGRTEREKNLSQSLFLHRFPQRAPEEVWLVDDVMTTGATARLCTRLLLDAGVLRVHFAVLAGP